MHRFGWLTRSFSLSWFGVLSVSTGRSEDPPVFDEGSVEFFEKEVRPILEGRCFECHSGGDRAPKGGLLRPRFTRTQVLQGATPDLRWY